MENDSVYVGVELGRVVMTAAIAELANSSPAFGQALSAALGRFRAGDWGELSPGDVALNEGNRASGYLLAAYTRRDPVSAGEDDTIWIIRDGEPGSFLTTVLFPSDY